MTRSVLVPSPISKLIRGFGLPRPTLIDFLNRLHANVVRDYEHFRIHRAENERFCKTTIATRGESGKRHLFGLVIDDTTSPDHLIVYHISHDIFP